MKQKSLFSSAILQKSVVAGFIQHHFSLERKSGAGFTLLEMLVYVFVLSVIISVVVSSLLWMLRAQGSVAATKEVVESTRAALTILENEIKEAQSVYVRTTTATQLSIETPRNPPAGEDTTYVDFFLCGTRLCIKRESQDPVAITSENVLIQNLTFERVETISTVPSVQIVFDAVYNNPSNRPELNASVQVQTTASQRTYGVAVTGEPTPPPPPPPVGFLYAVQVEDLGVEMKGTTSITGDVYANSTVKGDALQMINGTVNVSGVGNKTEKVTVSEDAYADICKDATITGDLYAMTDDGCSYASFTSSGAPPAVPAPFTAAQISDFESEASVGGIFSGNKDFTSGTNDLGPLWIDGDLKVRNSAVLNVTGTIWVTGKVTVDNSAKVQLDSAIYGSTSGVIGAEDIVEFKSDVDSEGSPGFSDSYLMFLSTSTASPAINIDSDGSADIFYAANGFIGVKRTGTFKALAGRGLKIENTANVVYESDIENAF